MTTTRPLTPSELRTFRLARLGAVERMPYFARALFAVQPLAAEGLETFAVDRWWRLYLDPARLIGPTAWPMHEQSGVLLHEVGHLIRDHAGRVEQLARPRSHDTWNLAGDAEINDDLLAAGTPLPEGVVTPSALGLPDGDLAEAYYAALHDPSNPAPPQDPSTTCGSGSGAVAATGEHPAAEPGPDGVGGLDAAEGSMIRRSVAHAVQAAADAKGRGTVPGGLRRWADATLATPTVPWPRVLRASVRRAVAAYAGRTDYTYRRPSRRRVPGIILPAMRGPRVNVSVVVDTSGSMSQSDLSAALSELGGVLATPTVAREHLRFLSCDAHAATPQRVRSLRSITLTGGGGTDMRIGIDAAMAQRPRPHVVIVLTDGDTPWPDAPLDNRTTLICAVISRRSPLNTPPWATTVHIPAD